MKKKNLNNIKNKSFFDHLKAITEYPYDPEYFDKLLDDEKKTFDVYMLNRYLSMNPSWIPIVNIVQRYSQYIPKKEIYKLYSEIIPKSKVFIRYMKSKKILKYNKELIKILTKHFKISSNKTIKYLDIIYNCDHKNELKEFLDMYGKKEKEIENLIKLKGE